MSTYWHKPGRFANELNIWRADTKEQESALTSHGYNRITREEARRLVSWTNAENRAWGSGNAFGFTIWHEVTHGDTYSAQNLLDTTDDH